VAKIWRNTGVLKLLLKKLNQLLDLMLEEREARKKDREELDQGKRDKELTEYAKKHMRKEPLPMLTSVDDMDRPVKTKARIAIPFNLTEDEKMLIEDFYGDDK